MTSRRTPANSRTAFGLAELRLLRLTGTTDRQSAAEALVALGELFQDAGLPHDAAYYYRLAAVRHPEITVADGQTARCCCFARQRYAIGDADQPR